MVAVIKNLMADRGATFRLSVRYKDPSGSPVDLTGYTALFVLLAPVTGDVFDTAPATVTADGWIRVDVADEVTATWPVGKTPYRLELEDPDGAVFWLLSGALAVRSGLHV